MKFNRKHVELTLFVLIIILTILVIYSALVAFEIFPNEIPPSEPFECPKTQ